MNKNTACRIAKALNAAVERGMGGNGVLVFGIDGSGGAWYSSDCYGFGDDCLVVPVPWDKITTQKVLHDQDMKTEAGL